MTLDQFTAACLRDPYVRRCVLRWLRRNPRPAGFEDYRPISYAYTEMSVIPLTRLWWRLRWKSK